MVLYNPWGSKKNSNMYRIEKVHITKCFKSSVYKNVRKLKHSAYGIQFILESNWEK